MSRVQPPIALAFVLGAASLIAAQSPPAAVTNLRVIGNEPVIWGVASSATTSSQATISWSTDVPSDSLIQYGVTTSYGSTTSRNPTLVTAHTMTITGLQASSLYHFRVRSRDSGGIEGVSSDYSFTTPAAATILWAGDHEEGDMSDWYVAGGGGEFNSGSAVSVASTDVAHTGTYSAKATITTPPNPSAVRLFRWGESLVNPQAYYGAWFYFPRNYTMGWWFIDQFKSRTCSGCNPDPFWFVQVANRPNGAMYCRLIWWYGPWPGGTVEGPHAGEFGGRTYEQTLKDLPTNQWVHIEIFLRQSPNFGGQIIVWQDGVEILRQDNVKTRYPYGGDEWSIGSYSDSISPSPATIYMDDAIISTGRIGP